MPRKFDPYSEWLKIPPEEQPPNYYRLLNISRFESDPAIIEDAVARWVIKLQNLSSGPYVEHAQRLLNKIAKARLCLSDPNSKQAYDEQLQRESRRAKFRDEPPKKQSQVEQLNSATTLLDPPIVVPRVTQSLTNKKNDLPAVSPHSKRRTRKPVRSKNNLAKPSQFNNVRLKTLGSVAGLIGLGLTIALFLYMRTTTSLEQDTTRIEAKFDSDSITNSNRRIDNLRIRSEPNKNGSAKTPVATKYKAETLPVGHTNRLNKSTLAKRTIPPPATIPPITFKPDQLSRFEKMLALNEFAHIEGVVVSTRASDSGKTLYLYFSEPREKTITVFIEKKYVGETLTEEITETFIGKRIQVRGEIRRQPGNRKLGVQIISAGQIEVME